MSSLLRPRTSRGPDGRLGGHDWGPVNFDSLGIFYICLSVIYTIIVFIGLGLLWWNRHKTAVRMRCLPLITTVILIVQFYTVFVLIVYPINGRFKCGMEFWTMNTIFPFGIALFQGQSLLHRLNWLAPIFSISNCFCLTNLLSDFHP